MAQASLSALITNQGERVLLRVQGRYYDLHEQELRELLNVPSGPPELGITIDGDRLCFEFADQDAVELSAKQLNRLLVKLATARA